jgi:hypothetical protein
MKVDLREAQRRLFRSGGSAFREPNSFKPFASAASASPVCVRERQDDFHPGMT